MGFFKKLFGSASSDLAKEESGYNYQKEEINTVKEEDTETHIIGDIPLAKETIPNTKSKDIVKIRYTNFGKEEETKITDGKMYISVSCLDYCDSTSEISVGDKIMLVPEIGNGYRVLPCLNGEVIGDIHVSVIPILSCISQTGTEATVCNSLGNGKFLRASIPVTMEYIDQHDYLKKFNVRFVTTEDEENEAAANIRILTEAASNIITDQDGNEYVCQELFAFIPCSKTLMEILVENFERKVAKEEVLFVGSLSNDGNASYVCQKMGATLRFNNDEMEDCMARGYFVCFSIENMMDNGKVAVLKLKVYFEKGGEPMG